MEVPDKSPLVPQPGKLPASSGHQSPSHSDTSITPGINLRQPKDAGRIQRISGSISSPAVFTPLDVELELRVVEGASLDK